MALHRPSPLMPVTPSAFVSTLYEAATISVDLYDHYSEMNQVLVNWVHLKQIFTSCTTLVYCFWEYQTRSDLVGIPHQQALERIKQCKQLLARFGPPWPQTQRYQAMFDNLAQSFSQQHHDNTSFLGVTADTEASSMHTQPNLTFTGDSMLDVLVSDHDSGMGLNPFDSTHHDLFIPQSPGTVMRGFWAENWIMAPTSKSI